MELRFLTREDGLIKKVRLALDRIKKGIYGSLFPYDWSL
jgi:RNA polymerase-binding transcription factor DksA